VRSRSSVAEAPRRVLAADWGVPATSPIRAIAHVSLATLFLGPPSLRTVERDAGAILGGGAGFDTTAVAQGALITAAFLTGLVLVLNPSVRRFWRSRTQTSRFERVCLGSLSLWVIYTGASISFSLSPLFSLVTWMRLTGLVFLLLVVIAIGRDRNSLVRFIWWYSLSKILVIGLLGVVDPNLVGRSIDLGYRLTGGILTDYGASGVLFVASSITLSRASPQRRLGRLLGSHPWLLAACIGVGGFYTLLARSRFSILALLAVLSMAAWFYRARFLTIVISTATVAAIAVDSSRFADVTLNTVFRGREGLVSVSARDLAFSHVLAWSAERRLFGAGFAAGSRAAMADFLHATGIQMGTPHDAFSASLADGGYVGLFVLGVLTVVVSTGVAIALILSRRTGAGSLSFFAASALLLALASSVAGGGIASADFLAVTPAILLVLSWTEVGREGDAGSGDPSVLGRLSTRVP
jgi:hypothetical protein